MVLLRLLKCLVLDIIKIENLIWQNNLLIELIEIIIIFWFDGITLKCNYSLTDYSRRVSCVPHLTYSILSGDVREFQWGVGWIGLGLVNFALVFAVKTNEHHECVIVKENDYRLPKNR